MTIRTQVMMGLAAVLAGCAAQVDENGIVENAEPIKGYCPDPTIGCTVSNGTGVYYEDKERGFAGIDALQLMISHFVNHAGTRVSFHGRYYDPSSNRWKVLRSPGAVARADVKGTGNYAVLAVSESGTNPTWTLADPVTGLPICVNGPDLRDLVLYLELDDPLERRQRLVYALDFGGDQPEEGNADVTIHQFVMSWHEVDTTHPGHPYCLDAAGNEDAVVFQGGISVDPVSGSVTRNSSTAANVTLSCRRGAIATVHAWGYPYLGPTAAAHFDAGIHMKRASYCGDAASYTIAGTRIQLWDDLDVNDQIGPGSRTEAHWTEHGATCVDALRQPALGFSGFCHGVKLPSCAEITDVPSMISALPPL